MGVSILAQSGRPDYTDCGKTYIDRAEIDGEKTNSPHASWRACGETVVQVQRTLQWSVETCLVNSDEATSGRARSGVTCVSVLTVGLNDGSGAGKSRRVVEHMITQRPHD